MKHDKVETKTTATNNCQRILTQNIRTLLMSRWQLTGAQAEAKKYNIVRKSCKKKGKKHLQF